MDKIELLDAYANGANNLILKMNTITDGMLEYRPEIEDAWTIKEHVIHLVDAEINGFITIKSIIAQPESTCFAIDGESWIRNTRFKNADINKYLSVFKLIREMVRDLLIGEGEETWTGEYAVWPYRGELLHVTIEECLESFIEHLDFHFAYIDRNIGEYKKEEIRLLR